MRFAQITQWARGAVALLVFISYWLEYQLLQQGLRGEGISASEAEANDWRIKLLGGLQLVVVLMAIIALVQWTYRAYQNVHRLPNARPSYRTGMAAWSWFIPFVNLWYPYKILQEIGQALGGFSSPDVKYVSSRWDYLLAGWWVLYIGGTIMTRLTIKIAAAADIPLAEMAQNDKLLMLAQVFTIASAVVTVALLKVIAPHEQRILAAQNAPYSLPTTTPRA